MSYSSADVSLLLSQIKENQHDTGYQIQLLNNFQQLSDAVKKQNDIIYSTYYDKIIFNSADGQKSKYIHQSSIILKNIFDYGFWIYIFFAIILCVVVYRQELQMVYKVLLIIAILTYPFYIYPLEELSYVISTYIWNLLISVAYNTGYGNMNLEHGLTKNSSGEDTINKIKKVSEDDEEDEEEKDPNEGAPPLFVPQSLPGPPIKKPLSTLQFNEDPDVDPEATPTPDNSGGSYDEPDPAGEI